MIFLNKILYTLPLGALPTPHGLLTTPQGAAPKVALPLGYGLYPFQGIFQQYLLLNNRVSPANETP